MSSDRHAIGCPKSKLDLSTRFQLCSSVCVSITGKCVKLHKRPLPPTAPDIQKQCTLSRRSGTAALPTQRPLRERIIHLLALKPFSKPELLLWMERDRASAKDKAELGGILEEVCVCVCLTNAAISNSRKEKQPADTWCFFQNRALMSLMLSVCLDCDHAHTLP